MVSSVTPVATHEGWDGAIKTVVLELSATPLASDQYDTKMDAADGKAAVFRQIFGAVYSATPVSAEAASLDGYPTPPSWDSLTGIVSLGRVTPIAPSGFLTIWGK